MTLVSARRRVASWSLGLLIMLALSGAIVGAVRGRMRSRSVPITQSHGASTSASREWAATSPPSRHTSDPLVTADTAVRGTVTPAFSNKLGIAGSVESRRPSERRRSFMKAIDRREFVQQLVVWSVVPGAGSRLSNIGCAQTNRRVARAVIKLVDVAPTIDPQTGRRKRERK